jgi:aminoglycoside phosphotransferase
MTSIPNNFAELFPSAPETILRILGNRKVIEVPTVYTESSVFKAKNSDHTLFLKIQSIMAFQSFAHEVEILEWLQGRLPVPEVIAFNSDTENEYMILSEVAGMNCVKAMETYDHRQIAELLVKV